MNSSEPDSCSSALRTFSMVMGYAVAVVIGAFLGLALSSAYARRRAIADASRQEQLVDRRVAERTAALQEELARAMRLAAVGQLVAGVGHEINNPLAYVLTNLELVTEQSQGNPDPEVLASLVDAKDGVERIRQIVRDLQSFSRTDEAEHMVDLNLILERCFRMANTQIRHSAQLVVDLGELPPVCANETRLGQVFLNLLVNAAQAIGEGGSERNEIRVRTFTDARGLATIEISDTGPGMSAETRAKIFDPFFTTKPVGSGTGLGLSICRTIIVALKGDIEVVSEPGRGALFRVTIPRAKVRRDRKASYPLVPSETRRRVLVVDDEPLICRAVQKSLSAEHDVVTEVSSRQALDRIRNGERFDVIFCDLMMPEMSGIDFYEAVRASCPDTLSRIVFMTGGVLSDRMRGFLVGNPNPLLDKPLRAKSLRRIVSAAPALVGPS